MDAEFPPAVLAKHPELAAVGEALEQDASGAAITAHCYFCGAVLVVDRVDEVGAVVVRCPNGDTMFRMSGRPR